MNEREQLMGPLEFNNGLKVLRTKCGNRLYPNTPIEVIVDTTSSRSHFSVYCQGEWSTSENSVYGVKTRIRELIISEGVSGMWDTPSLYINPTWPGWTKINLASMSEVIESVQGDVVDYVNKPEIIYVADVDNIVTAAETAKGVYRNCPPDGGYDATYHGEGYTT